MPSTKLAEGNLCSDNDFGCYRSDDEHLMDALVAVCGENTTQWKRVSRNRYRATGIAPSGQRYHVDILRSED